MEGTQLSLATSFVRKIKRQIWAKTHDFFVSCLPGLENLLVQELRELGISVTSSIPGGVNFSAGLESVYYLHLHSRLAGRVLWRLKNFRMRNLEDIKAKLLAIPWEILLPAGAFFKINNVLSQGRNPSLVTGLLAGCITQTMAGFHMEPPVLAVGPDSFSLYLREDNHHLTVSLDLSGQHLSRRGYRTQPGIAPLREDLAAGLLKFCDYQGQVPLLDPMCGSGTLALEAGIMAKKLIMERNYAINLLPFHRSATWNFLKTQAKMAALVGLPQPIYAQDKSNLSIARQNTQKAGLDADVQFYKFDFFQAPPPTAQPGLLVINPPYGLRLGSKKQARDIIYQINKRINEIYQGWQIGLILYEHAWRNLLKLKQPAALIAPHGGLKITLFKGRI